MLLTLFTFVPGVIYYRTGWDTGWDRAIYDIYQRKLSFELKNPSCVFVVIDQRSLEHFKENSFISWPWPRSLYVPVIEFLKRCGAKTIVFDIIFSSPSIYSVEDDLKFKEAIKKAGNVYIPFVSGTGSEDASKILKFSLDISDFSHVSTDLKVLLPHTVFVDVIKGTGNTRGYPDVDGIYRGYAYLVMIGDKYFPSLPLAVYLDSEDDGGILSEIKNYRDSLVYLKFYYPLSFKSYSILDVIQSELSIRKNQVPFINPQVFKDKVVFI